MREGVARGSQRKLAPLLLAADSHWARPQRTLARGLACLPRPSPREPLRAPSSKARSAALRPQSAVLAGPGRYQVAPLQSTSDCFQSFGLGLALEPQLLPQLLPMMWHDPDLLGCEGFLSVGCEARQGGLLKTDLLEVSFDQPDPVYAAQNPPEGPNGQCTHLQAALDDRVARAEPAQSICGTQTS